MEIEEIKKMERKMMACERVISAVNIILIFLIVGTFLSIIYSAGRSALEIEELKKEVGHLKLVVFGLEES